MYIYCYCTTSRISRPKNAPAQARVSGTNELLVTKGSEVTTALSTTQEMWSWWAEGWVVTGEMKVTPRKKPCSLPLLRHIQIIYLCVLFCTTQLPRECLTALTLKYKQTARSDVLCLFIYSYFKFFAASSPPLSSFLFSPPNCSLTPTSASSAAASSTHAVGAGDQNIPPIISACAALGEVEKSKVS